MSRYFERKAKKLNDILKTAGGVTTKDMIVYKKARYGKGTKAKYCIVRLLIPEGSRVMNRLMANWDARFTSSTVVYPEKCRANRVKVLEIRTFNEKTKKIGRTLKHASSIYARNGILGALVRTQYRVGRMVYPNGFNTSPYVECNRGIHFFVTREEAMDY